MLLALSTGGRKDEVRTLRWSEVDINAGLVWFLETKTDRARSVPLRGEALRVLRALYRGQSPRTWVFPSPCGPRPRSFECAWRKARQRAGLANFRFHDLRHTYASYLAMSGASLRDIAELLGHASTRQTAMYTHLLQSHTAGIVEKMTTQFL